MTIKLATNIFQFFLFLNMEKLKQEYLQLQQELQKQSLAELPSWVAQQYLNQFDPSEVSGFLSF